MALARHLQAVHPHSKVIEGESTVVPRGRNLEIAQNQMARQQILAVAAALLAVDAAEAGKKEVSLVPQPEVCMSPFLVMACGLAALLAIVLLLFVKEAKVEK